LKAGCPDGVDPTSKEQHLSDDDFAAVFGMSKEEFNGMAAWKRKKAKQQHGLF